MNIKRTELKQKNNSALNPLMKGRPPKEKEKHNISELNILNKLLIDKLNEQKEIEKKLDDVTNQTLSLENTNSYETAKSDNSSEFKSLNEPQFNNLLTRTMLSLNQTPPKKPPSPKSPPKSRLLLRNEEKQKTNPPKIYTRPK